MMMMKSTLVAVAVALLTFSSPLCSAQRLDCSTSDGRPGQCRPLVKCIRFTHEIPTLVKRHCPLATDEKGVCCPHIVLGTATFSSASQNSNSVDGSTKFIPRPPVSRFHRKYSYFYYYRPPQPRPRPPPTFSFAVRKPATRRRPNGRVLRRPPAPPVTVPPIRTADIDSANVRGRGRRDRRRFIERRLAQVGLTLSRRGNRSPVAKHRRLQKANPVARRLGNRARALEDTSQELRQSFNLSPAQGTHALNVFSLVGTTLAVEEDDDRCNEISGSGSSGPRTRRTSQRCRTADKKFRTLDGSCNNRRNPTWGQANTALQRILHPKYDDGISSPRGQESDLPSARSVSDSLIPDRDAPSRDFTLLLMQWGQFLDHDITHTPLVKGEDDEDILCCDNGQTLQGDLFHPECLPIDIAQADSFYGRLGQRCMEFVRSMPARNPACSLGPREQVNQITSFIDASNVYGSDLAESRSLRLGRGGRLRVTKFRQEELLPLDPDECADHAKRQYCFAAGDSRANEQPQLTVVHTLWLREHNRVASQLALLNSHWDDERLFQEARKIVGAQMQHITYNEWLPIILGMNYVEENDLSPAESGLTGDYDESIDPSIVNAFATAAFRFGHSLVQGHMESISVFGNQLKSLRLHRHQLLPFEIYEENSIDGLLRGLTTQPAQEVDVSFSTELTERLFQDQNTSHGMDLVSLNLQRGRDHGLPSFLEYRRLCGLSEISGWRDLVAIVQNPELVPRIQRLYRGIEDIDLFLGGMIEKAVSGSVLGPTFQCLVGDQFKRLKFGDRFWFEESGHEGAFTEEQVDALRQSSLARVLCDNGDNIQLMQPLAFKIARGMNEKVGCNGSKAIPRINLEAWRE